MESQIRDALDGFMNSKDIYGEITDVDTKSAETTNFIKDYAMKSGSTLCFLKCQNTIFLSKSNPAFDQLYEVVKKFGTLLIEKGVLELWDDKENKVLNVIFPSIKRHFLAKYSTEEDKALKISAIMNENP